jgi:hypothetical protein
MQEERTLISINVLVCLFVIIFSANVYSQQKSGGPQGLETQQNSEEPKNLGSWPRRDAISIEVLADLSVSPLTYSGSCPAIFTFKGRITANRKTAVQYKFIRSDGVQTEVKTLAFAKPGPQEVTYIWQLGDPVTLPAFSGAVMMEVVFPINKKIRTNEASFRGSCTSSGQPATMSFPMPKTTQQGSVMPQGPSLPAPTPQGASMPQSLPMPQPAPPGSPVPQGLPIPKPAPSGSPMPQNLPMPQPAPSGSSMPQSLPGPQSFPPQQMVQQVPFAKPSEDCLFFNPATTKVQQSQGRWRVADGANILFDLATDKIEAENALAIIQHYKLNQSCFAGRPKPFFHFMLAGGFPPVGPFPGEDCRSFNPVTTKVQQIKGSWKIVDGSQTLFDFGPNKADADQSLAIIRNYGFTHTCMMARGSLDFLYLRK